MFSIIHTTHYQLCAVGIDKFVVEASAGSTATQDAATFWFGKDLHTQLFDLFRILMRLWEITKLLQVRWMLYMVSKDSGRAMRTPLEHSRVSSVH